MKNVRTKLCTAIAAAALLTTQQALHAVPVNGGFIDDPRCDNPGNQVLTHELGDLSTFPMNEAIVVSNTAATSTVCVPNDGVANDWIVEIRNVSGQAWKNLFFVADHNVTIGNSDGSVVDATVPNAGTDAFRIDGTVTAGTNSNLLFESMTVDEIFQPGEIWRFNVSNFSAVTAAGAPQPPIIISPGIFAGSTNFPQTPGNSSILATVVPEPVTVSVLALGASALLMRRPGRRRR